MTDHVSVACVQMTSGPQIEENLKVVEGLISEAAARGAKLICTPENTDFMCAHMADKIAVVPSEESHPALSLCAGLACRHKVWILLGSIAIKISADKMANRSYLFNEAGEIVARYDKIHLFDAQLSEDECYKESAFFMPGDKAVVAQAPWCKLGMSICYDVRFAYLYRRMAQAGAAIMTVPAAFAATTGRCHWEVLLRARAIETGSFILAPAQCGIHEGNRKTWGHALIIGPWGDIVAQADDQPGYILADIDLSAVQKARRAVASFQRDCCITLSDQ